MQKMRSKKDIIDYVASEKGVSTEAAKLRVALCRLEVELDKRDLLVLICDELRRMNGLEPYSKEV